MKSAKKLEHSPLKQETKNCNNILSIMHIKKLNKEIRHFVVLEDIKEIDKQIYFYYYLVDVKLETRKST